MPSWKSSKTPRNSPTCAPEFLAVVRTHVLSIRGSDYTWFKRALERGDLATVRSELSDLPPLKLEDALSVALLICEHEPENAERAAVRWLRRLLEQPGVTLAELREALDAFAVVVEERDAAEARLRRLVG